MNTTSTAVVKLSVEVITLPVGDVQRALRSPCRLRRLHARRRLFAERRVPRCAAHSAGLQLLDPDRPRTCRRARRITSQRLSRRYRPRGCPRSRLLERGVEVGEIRHKVPVDVWNEGFAPGLDPARRDYASFADFSDPDGNSWVLQERGYRNA